MTVIQPNSISGINSITVATGEALQVHAANGDLVSTLTTASGIATYKGIHVGSGTTTSNQGISVGTGCSIVSDSVNTLDVYTNNTKRFSISASGFISHYGAGAFEASGANYLRIGSTDAGGAILGLDGDSNGDGSGADYCMIKHDTDGDLKIIGDNPANAANIIFYSNTSSERLRIDGSNGNLTPGGDASQDLGSISKRWANIYSADLQLSNEGSKNDVDGTWGNYTIQEGESDLFLINRRNGKKYKFNLTEVS